MKRVPELDSLRGVAALAVLAHHCPWFYNRPQVGAIVGRMYLAVDLFFVLSGYLITTIIVSHDYRSPRFLYAFYARRLLRIWPVYYVVLALTLALSLAHLIEWPYPWSTLPGFLLFFPFLPAYVGREPTFYDPLNHFWSVAVEEQFYLFWPALIGLLGRKRLVFPIIAVIAISVVTRAAGMYHQVLATRCDGLAFGAAVALLLADGEVVRRRVTAYRRALFAALAFGFTYPIWGRLLVRALRAATPSAITPDLLSSLNIVFFDAAMASFVGLIVIESGHRVFAPLRWQPLMALGSISYGLYMYHNLIRFLILGPDHKRGDLSTFPAAALFFAGSFALAIASWRFLERPILGWKDRFPYPAPVKEDASDIVEQPHEKPAVAS